MSEYITWAEGFWMFLSSIFPCFDVNPYFPLKNIEFNSNVENNN